MGEQLILWYDKGEGVQFSIAPGDGIQCAFHKGDGAGFAFGHGIRSASDVGQVAGLRTRYFQIAQWPS
jgi:hypothetical protein